MVKTYFKWAEFRSTKVGIKIHTKFNLGKGIPELIIVSNAKSHDRTKMKELSIVVLEKTLIIKRV